MPHSSPSDRRRRRLARRPDAVEALERRQMLAGGIPRPALLVEAAVRPDLDAWAWQLAMHPATARARGLGDLADALRTHPAIVRQHGPGALLAFALARHPRYAARHGLTGLMTAAPSAGAGSPVANPPSSSATTPVAPPASTPGRSASAAGPGTTGTGGAGLAAPSLRPPPPMLPTDGIGPLMTACCDDTGSFYADGPGGGGSGLGGQVLGSDVGLITGQLVEDHPLSAYQTRGLARGLDLQYSSLRADARPDLEVTLTTRSGSNSANLRSVAASMTLNGVSQGAAVTFTTSGFADGSTYRIGLQTDATAMATGVYPITLTLVKTFVGGSTVTETYSDSLDVVNDGASTQGAGWSFNGLERLTGGAGTDPVLLTEGAVGYERFTTANGSTYSGYSWDFAALAKSGGTWTRTFPDGTVVAFDTNGRETSATDRNGNATTYAYVPSGVAAGSLATVTDPVGKVTTLAYDPTSGALTSVTDPAMRVTTFAHDGSGNLTGITDPDGAVTTFAYGTPANHRITSEINPDGKTAAVHYDTFAKMTDETLFDGASTTSTSGAQKAGLVAAGGTGPLPTMDTYKGSITDPDGHTTTVAYDFNGHATAVTDPNGQLTTYTRDVHELPVQVTDRDGRVTSYTFDALGSVTGVTRPDASAMGITYGVDEQPATVGDYRGLITSYTLDSHGNATRRTDPDSNHEDWTYNSAGQVLTDSDRNGHVTSFAYDSAGRLTTVTVPDAGSGIATIAYGYDSAGDPTSVTDALGHVTRAGYDAMGRLTSTADPVQYAASTATSYAYDAAGNLTSATDALGHVTSYAYDARNRLVGVVDPVNQGSSRRTTLTWGAYDLSSVTDPNGHTASFTYDNLGRLKTAKDADGDVTSYAYDNEGQLLAVTDPNSHVTSYAYDVVGRVTTVTLPGTADNGSGTLIPVVYKYAYNADDQRTAVTDALGHATTTTYDNLGRVSAVTDALSHATTYGYDLAGNLTSVTDALGHITSSTYDARDRLRTTVEPSGGGTTTYAYDQAGRVTSLTDADSNATSWGYDDADRATTETDPRGKVTTIAYDVAGRVTQVTDRDGRVIQYGYDADDRPTTEKWVSGGTTLRAITSTYDYGGRLTQVQDPDSKYAYAYSNADRLLTVDDNGTSSLPQVTLTYGYDPGGNTTSLDDSLGGRTSYTYDVRDELVTIAQSGSGVASKRADFGYDAAMRRTTLTRYSDTSGTTTVLATKYAYDAANRLTTLTHLTSGGTVRSQYVYTMDAANRLTSEARTWQNSGTQTDTVAYAYTNNNQLTGVTHTNGSFAAESYGYDATGNRSANTTTTGNRLASDGTYNYGYDDEGNLTSKTVIATGNQTLYTYDYRNRLTEVDSKISGVTTTLALYTYDALDRRIKVVEGGVTTATLYDGEAAILDFDGSGTQAARYLQGPMVDEVLAREASGGTVAWYLADREGTIRDLANNSGAVIDHVDYNAYGVVTGESAPASGDRWKYAGREYDATTGLYFNRARWYDPSSGRFVSQDPTSFAAGDVNLYRYTGNGPTDGTDPSGLDGKYNYPGGNGIGAVYVLRGKACLTTGGGTAAIIIARRKKLRREYNQLIINMLKKAFDELEYQGHDVGLFKFPPDTLKPNFDLYEFDPNINDSDPNAFAWQNPAWFPGPYKQIDKDHGWYTKPVPSTVQVTSLFYQSGFQTQVHSILHEVFHTMGYWARPGSKDDADTWAGDWMMDIYGTKVYKDFISDPEIKKFHDKLKNM